MVFIYGPALKFQSIERNRWIVSLLLIVRFDDQNEFYAPNLRYWLELVQNPPDSSEIMERPLPPGEGLRADFIQRKYPLEKATWIFRCEIAVPMDSTHHVFVSYKVDLIAEKRGYIVPPIGAIPSAIFFSCNGFHSWKTDAPDSGGAIDKPMWNQIKQSKRLPHLLVGGGDQIYCDSVWETVPALIEWLAKYKLDHGFRGDVPTSDLENQFNDAYFCLYMDQWLANLIYAWFLSCAPTIKNWDDHDTFDGRGSYSEEFQEIPLVKAVIRASRRAYLLFQQHYIEGEESTLPRSLLMDRGNPSMPDLITQIYFIGPIAIVSPDTRTRRNLSTIIPISHYESITSELYKHQCKFIWWIIPLPILYPQLNHLINLGKVFLEPFGLMQDRFGNVTYFDDFRDQWSDEYHRKEREVLIKIMMRLSYQSDCTHILLTGDTHCANYGRIFSPHCRPIHQFISSPIGNVPVSNCVNGLIEAAIPPGGRLKLTDDGIWGKLEGPFINVRNYLTIDPITPSRVKCALRFEYGSPLEKTIDADFY